jgi:hypothetical protein
MKRQNFDASTYTKFIRQRANANLYQADLAAGIPQYERKSIVSRAPFADVVSNALQQELFPGSSLVTTRPINGALVFDGSSYLRTTDADLNVGTGDFAAEFYFKGTTIPGRFPRLFALGDNITLSCETPDGSSTTQFYLYYPSTVAMGSIENTSISDKWTYLALVRVSGTVTLYINGIALRSLPITFSPSNNDITIGSNGTVHYTGQITQFRLTVGTAVYTSNFVRPVVQLKPLGDTVLLLNVASDASKYVDSARAHTVTPTNTVSYTPIVPPIY